jgi:hypothetical protein
VQLSAGSGKVSTLFWDHLVRAKGT